MSKRGFDRRATLLCVISAASAIGIAVVCIRVLPIPRLRTGGHVLAAAYAAEPEYETLRRVLALQRAENYEEAAALCEELRRRASDPAVILDTYRLEGDAWAALGHHHAAVDRWRQAIDRFGSDPGVITTSPWRVAHIAERLATTQRLLRSPEEAKATLNVLTEQPDLLREADVFEARSTRAWMAIQEEDAADARRWCDTLEREHADLIKHEGRTGLVLEYRVRIAELEGNDKAYIALLDRLWARRESMEPTRAMDVGSRLVEALRRAGDTGPAADFALEFAHAMEGLRAKSLAAGEHRDADMLLNEIHNALEWVARTAWRKGYVVESAEAIAMLRANPRSGADLLETDRMLAEMLGGLARLDR